MSVAIINGISYGWRDIYVVLFGQPVVGITKVTAKEKQTKTNNYGIGASPVSRGYGNIEPEASIEVYSEEFFKLITAAGGSLLKVPPFDLTIVLGNSALGLENKKIVLRACEFTESGIDVAQGDQKISVTLAMVVGAIDWPK